MMFFLNAKNLPASLAAFGTLALLGFTGCAHQPPPAPVSCSCNCGGPSGPPGKAKMRADRGDRPQGAQQRRVPREFFEACKEKAADDVCSVSLGEDTIAGKCAVAPAPGPRKGGPGGKKGGPGGKKGGPGGKKGGPGGKKGGPDGKKGGPDGKKGGPDAETDESPAREPKLMCWPDQPVAFGASDGRQGGPEGGRRRRADGQSPAGPPPGEKPAD